MDIYDKIAFNLNIIKNNSVNYNLNKINFGFDKMILLKNNFNSEDIKGIPYYCENNSIPFIIKIFPKKSDDILNLEIVYSTLFNNELLNNFISPNFISIYDYSYYISNNKKCLAKIPLGTLKTKKSLVNYTDILLYEFVSEKDIDTFHFNSNFNCIKLWKSITFQVIYNLSLLQNKYSFMHNDLHPANILIDKVNDLDIINYIFNDNSFYIPAYGYIVKFWDFEYSNIHDNNYKNIKNNLCKINYSKFYDLHTFLIGLLDLDDLPLELINFINQVYPKTLLDKNSKHLDNGLLTIDSINKFKSILPFPEQLIYHDFFKEYQINNVKGNIFTFNYNSI